MSFTRTVRAAVLGIMVLGAAHGAALAQDLPEVPQGTVLRIGDPQTQKALELSGIGAELPFQIEWANIAGGPPSLEAFRAGALDLSVIADIPTIHATWTNLPVGVVGVRYKVDPVANPFTALAIAPGVEFNGLADLAGKRIAYSPGQIHGVVVLRALAEAGLTQNDVTLIELPLVGDAYNVALAAGQIDVAPIHSILIARYLTLYEQDGAQIFYHGIRDDASFIYAPQPTLDDPAKAAALEHYAAAWARATQWIYDNPEIWIEEFYIGQEGLSREDAEWLVEFIGEYTFPENWDEVIARHQETIELLAAATGQQVYDAERNFDRRFEHVAAAALAQ